MRDSSREKKKNRNPSSTGSTGRCSSLFEIARSSASSSSRGERCVGRTVRILRRKRFFPCKAYQSAPPRPLLRLDLRALHDVAHALQAVLRPLRDQLGLGAD